MQKALGIESNGTDSQLDNFIPETPVHEIVSSRVVWADCIHLKDKTLMAPKNLRCHEGTQKESLLIEWQKPLCSESGYISYYILKYCESDHCATVNGIKEIQIDHTEGVGK